MEPSEKTVALVDMGVEGRFLCAGCHLVGEVLQWFDGKTLHLIRGRMLADRTRKRSFEFERFRDKSIIKFVELSSAAFESRLRTNYPDAPLDCESADLRKWLRENYGLWPVTT